MVSLPLVVAGTPIYWSSQIARELQARRGGIIWPLVIFRQQNTGAVHLSRFEVPHYVEFHVGRGSLA
jgi:hypothetical protein